jgi:DNA-binding MarR family transcriptional regulator
MSVQSYRKYLELRISLSEISTKYDLNIDEEVLIDYVAHLAKPLNNSIVTFKMLTSARELGHPSTIHTRLHTLIERNFLEVKTDPNDGRSKFITLGKLGLLRASEVSRLIVKFNRQDG